MQKLVITSDGSHTIYIPEMNEHYHSVHGAIQESDHIFINSGLRTVSGNKISILEIGFGTGLNALLTLLELKDTDKIISYTSIEKYPLTSIITGKLNYGKIIGDDAVKVFNELHSCPWNKFVQITRNFSLRKVSGDLTLMVPEGQYNLVYFDAFGPDKQPEMWSKEIFSAISAVTQPEGVLVTYSAKGEVKRNLRANGFKVKLLPGPPGKRQMIRAIKI